MVHWNTCFLLLRLDSSDRQGAVSARAALAARAPPRVWQQALTHRRRRRPQPPSGRGSRVTRACRRKRRPRPAAGAPRRRSRGWPASAPFSGNFQDCANFQASAPFSGGRCPAPRWARAAGCRCCCRASCRASRCPARTQASARGALRWSARRRGLQMVVFWRMSVLGSWVKHAGRGQE